MASKTLLTSVGVGLLFGLIVITSTGCFGEGENVTVENRSSETVVVFEDGTPLSLLHPNVSEDFHIPRFSGTLQYQVQSFESRLVLAEIEFTWDEIVKENGLKIVID